MNPSFFFMIFFLAITWFIIVFIVGTKKSSAHPAKTVSDDGHRIPRNKDITCNGKYGHDHPEETQPRYIVHEEPEDGYVVLNGVKRKLEDCKHL